MRQWYLGAIVATVAAVGGNTTAHAHSPYGKALKAHYELKAVTCYACHLKGKDPQTGKPLGKEHLNTFGTVLHEALKDKQVTQAIEAAKKEKPAQRKKVNDWAAEEFLKSFANLATQPTADGPTWEELIKSGALEGIKLAGTAGDTSDEPAEDEDE